MTGILLGMPSCTALPAIRGYFTPDEVYRNAAALVGREITIRGKIEVVSSSCTLAVCPPGNRCCNGCYHQLGFRVDTYRYVYLSGKDSGCSGDSCQTECPPFEAGKVYQVTGILTAFGGITYELEIIKWGIVE